MTDLPTPTCFRCHRPPAEIPGWMYDAHVEGMDVNAYAKADGTYNPVTNHFACDTCYLAIGQPAYPWPGTPWVAP